MTKVAIFFQSFQLSHLMYSSTDGAGSVDETDFGTADMSHVHEVQLIDTMATSKAKGPLTRVTQTFIRRTQIPNEGEAFNWQKEPIK